MDKARELLDILEWVPIKPVTNSINNPNNWKKVVNFSGISYILDELKKNIGNFSDSYEEIWMSVTDQSVQLLIISTPVSAKDIRNPGGRFMYGFKSVNWNRNSTKWKRTLTWDIYPGDDLKDLVDKAIKDTHLWAL